MRTLPAIPLLFLAAGCGGGGSTTEDLQATTSAPPARTSSTSVCERVARPAAKANGTEKRPTAKLDPAKRYDAVVDTSCGTFTIALDLKDSPQTTASFASLARKGFFDDTIFHRIVPGFVIQGGDPTGEGTGGPGYSTVDRPPADARYTRGVVAMAKTQVEAPGTAGSQFFVVTAADTQLPPDYALLGRVTKGLDVVERIGRLGDPATEQPTQTVVVRKIEIRER